MARLLVVTGPPGAGKSSLCAALAESSERNVLVDGDAFFGFLARGAVEPWLRGAHAQNDVVIRAAAAATGEFVRGGYETVYDGVVGPWFLPTFARWTGLEQLDYVVVLPPVETCVERVATRRDHGFVDERATRQMHRQFAAAEIDQRHVLVEQAGDAADVAAAITAARQAGLFVHAEAADGVGPSEV